MRYFLLFFLLACSSVPVDRKMERFKLVDGDFPDIEFCIMDEPSKMIHCKKVQSKKEISRSINQSDTYLMISQRDFLKVREYLYKRFKEERNGRHF